MGDHVDNGASHWDSLRHMWNLPQSQPSWSRVPRGQYGLQQGDSDSGSHVFWALSARSPARETEADREDAGMSASVTSINCLILADLFASKCPVNANGCL